MDSLPTWLEGARLAPSAHNTQPWRFVVLSHDRIRVGWDPRRSLPESDPTGRDLYLGLGAAVEAASLCSAAAGTSLQFIPEASEQCVGYLVPTSEQPVPSDLRLARSLRTRHTARAPHLARSIPSEILDELQAEADRGGCRLWIVTDIKFLRLLGTLAQQATAALYADPVVHRELWQWLRLDPNDPAYRRDGLTAECLELYGAALVAARMLLPPSRMRLLVRLGVHHLLAYDAKRSVQRSGSVCLLTAPSGDRETMVRTGRTLLRLWLSADQAGLTTHPMSALLDCAATVAPTLSLYGASGNVPANIFRLGYCPPVARAPRLPVSEIVESAL